MLKAFEATALLRLGTMFGGEPKMPSTSDRVSEIVLNIYDAAMDDSVWPGVLEQIASLFRAHQTVFDIYDVKAGAGSLSFATRIEDTFRKD